MDTKLQVLLKNQDDKGIEDLFYGDGNSQAFFSVDWRADEADVVEDCAACLGLNSLSAEWSDDGESLTILYNDQQTNVPLVHDTADRHTVVAVLNQVLKHEYEIRYLTISTGTDTAGFAVMSRSDWSELEADYALAVEENFVKLNSFPNIFTEMGDRHFPQAARARLKRFPAKPKGNGKKRWWPW